VGRGVEAVSNQIRTILNDILFVFVLGLAIIIFALIYHINPKGKKSEEDIVSPGNVIAEIRWFPDDLNCDVDLWVQGPDGPPVGYSNLRGALWNLLRDDLGDRQDNLGLNYEHAFTRGTLPGEYTVNIHMYRCQHFPVRVTSLVTVIRKPGRTRYKSVVHDGEDTMTRQGEQITVVRFTLDKEGRYSNVHNAFKKLRN
jgi:hypothetical protein